MGTGTIYRILHGVHCTVQQATAKKVLLALEHRRKEDRSNKAIHTRYLKVRQEEARRQDRLERMVGY